MNPDGISAGGVGMRGPSWTEGTGCSMGGGGGTEGTGSFAGVGGAGGISVVGKGAFLT